PAWLFSRTWVIPAFVLMDLWSSGGGMLIWLAALGDVPRALYEAAALDGAGPVRRFIRITLPMISPVIFFNLVMATIHSFEIFSTAYVMTQGGPGNASLFYVLYLFDKAFVDFRFGYASALAWVLFVIVMGLTVLVFKSSALWVYYEGELVSKRGPAT
ncbi:MAG: sugar ABC transporter permease, partial [Chloroflexi bacterium]|nr:sugar ABC transporter permease [Chloroflexota bacterium]